MQNTNNYCLIKVNYITKFSLKVLVGTVVVLKKMTLSRVGSTCFSVSVGRVGSCKWTGGSGWVGSLNSIEPVGRVGSGLKAVGSGWVGS